jgi:hypothetical protein
MDLRILASDVHCVLEILAARRKHDGGGCIAALRCASSFYFFCLSPVSCVHPDHFSKLGLTINEALQVFVFRKSASACPTTRNTSSSPAATETLARTN